MSHAQHGVRAHRQHPRGLAGALAHPGLPGPPGRGQRGDPAHAAALSGGVEARSRARAPALPREPRAGRLPSLPGLAAARSLDRPAVVRADPDRPPVLSRSVSLTRRLFGPSAALAKFYTALKFVARSGEVWCEGARVFLNPTSRHFSPLNAQRCLMFAVHFAPQYGDSFIEVSSFLPFHLGRPALHDPLRRAPGLRTEQQSLLPLRLAHGPRLSRDSDQVHLSGPQLWVVLVPSQVFPAGERAGGRAARGEVHGAEGCDCRQCVL